MAKESVKARQLKREAMVAKYAAKREALKKAGDFLPKGYMRDFGICRNQFRDLASMGKIPGVTKSSW
jgi:small subunit ribosomal protein S14